MAPGPRTLCAIDSAALAILANLASSVLWDGGKRLTAAIQKWRQQPANLDRLCDVVAGRSGEALPPSIISAFLDRDDLVQLLQSDPRGAAEALATDAAVAGVHLARPTDVLSAMLASLAASDGELAARLHRVNVIRLLEGLEVGLEYVFDELLGEILTVRQALDPSSRRTRRLSTILAESEAMVVQSFTALGVEEPLAQSLAKDPTVGTDVRAADGEVLVLTAVAGSGKTLTAIRSHQVNIVDAVLDPNAPLPVLVHARAVGDADLREVVAFRTRALGDLYELGVRLVLDGLDEVSGSEAQRLLSEASVVASAWPSSAAVAFGRPDVPYSGVRTSSLPLPSPEALEMLVSAIVGRAHPFWNFSPALRRAVELPLYAIAAAVLVHRNRALPQSRAAIVEALIGLCLKDADVLDEALLRQLAVELACRGSITETDFGRADAARLAASRLVIREGGNLRFAVPIYEDWFAAQALMIDAAVERLPAGDPIAFSQWRHAFSLALAVGSPNIVDELATQLTIRASAGLRLVLDEATSSPLPGKADPSPPADATARIQRSLAATYAPFLGALATAGREAVDPSKTDLDVRDEWTHVDFRNADDTPLRHFSTIVNGAEPAWPWRLAAGWVATDLDDVVDRRLLDVVHPVVDAENAWAVARLIADDRSLLHRPLDPAQVLDSLPRPEDVVSNEPVVLAGQRQLWMSGVALQRALKRIARLRDQSEPLVRPWPVADNLRSGSGWTDDLYSAPTAARLVRSVIEAALEIYAALVEKWFPAAATFLATNATLPAQVTCMYRPRRGAEPGALLSTKWHPLPGGSDSRVALAIVEDLPGWDYPNGRAEWTKVWSTAGRTAPPFSKAFGESRGIVHGLHSDRPAIHQAFGWLSTDLDTLKWTDRMVPLQDPD